MPADRIATLLREPIAPLPVWIGPALIPKGGKMVFASTAKAGKSYTMLSMARAMALAESPWGCPYFTVPVPVRCLLIEAELGKRGLQGRVQPIFGDIQAEKVEDLLWYVSKDPEVILSDPDGRKYLQDIVNKVQPQVLLLDPIGKMHFYDENSSTEISRLMHFMDRLIVEFAANDMSIAMSHHYGKPSNDPRDTSDPLSPYMMRGSSKWYDDPDTLGTFQRKQDLRPDGSAWIMNCRWECRQGETPGDMIFSVNRDFDWRVRYERDLKPANKPASLSTVAAGP